MFTRLLFCLALLLVPAPALAWWDYGHRTTAAIALAEVRPATRARIAALLRAERAVATPTCPLRSLEDASVWPDCVRPLRDRFSYSAPWHYQNVDVCRPFDATAACANGNCVSAQIERNQRLLADRRIPARERLVALAFLTHFVGDLHMPLHAGDRGDRGGNDLRAAYGLFEGRRTNLHSIWDGYLAERAISTPPGGPAGVRGAVAAERGGTVEDWSRESWAVSRDSAYAMALGGDPCGPPPARARLTDAQIETLVPVVRLQVARAGVRLARLLDDALATPPVLIAPLR